MQVTAAILTVSDSCANGTRQDLSGPALKQVLETTGFEIVAQEIVPDDRKIISTKLRELAKIARFVVTTGGTGISERDVTPEATRDVCERLLDGVSELMRSEGLKQTPLAPLSRARKDAETQRRREAKFEIDPLCVFASLRLRDCIQFPAGRISSCPVVSFPKSPAITTTSFLGSKYFRATFTTFTRTFCFRGLSGEHCNFAMFTDVHHVHLFATFSRTEPPSTTHLTHLINAAAALPAGLKPFYRGL